jgi:hypothetical protein
MPHQRIGIALDIGAAGAEQLGPDCMEGAVGIGPRIDLGIQFGNETSREYFRAFSPRLGRNPCFLRARQILRGDALTQIARARQRTWPIPSIM